jgi:hypothetical protein
VKGYAEAAKKEPKKDLKKGKAEPKAAAPVKKQEAEPKGVPATKKQDGEEPNAAVAAKKQDGGEPKGAETTAPAAPKGYADAAKVAAGTEVKEKN